MKDNIELLNIVIESCKQGLDGTWDCSTNEGKEGFQSMIDVLQEVVNNLTK